MEVEARITKIKSVLLLILITTCTQVNLQNVVITQLRNTSELTILQTGDAESAFYFRSCYHTTLLFMFESNVTITKHPPEPDNLTCEFNFDYINLKTDPAYQDTTMHDFLELPPITWFCRLHDTSELCNGNSECQTDECHCHDNIQSPVFYCRDGSGCISWNRLCNSIQDCTDGSDECFCSGFVVVAISPGTTAKICVSEERYCTAKALGYLPVEHSLEAGTPKCNEQDFQRLNPLHSCIYEAIRLNPLLRDYAGYCRNNCSDVDGFAEGWERFCDHVKEGYHFIPEFLCDPKNIPFEKYYLRDLCDGKVQCDNHADERGCPGRFYCSPNQSTEWVDHAQVCDNVIDCAVGTDECNDSCDFEELSSSESLIKSNFVVVVAVIIGILIISLNKKEGYECLTMPPTSKVKDIENVFLIQIFFHDILMGVYLCCIVLASTILNFKGQYCKIKQKWRASTYCSVLGVLFSYSSHGSLMLIAFMSITRFLACQGIDIRKRVIVSWSIFINICNLLHSLLPLMPVTAIKDIFRTEIFFTELKQNPFFSANPINRTRLAVVHKGMFHRDDRDIYRMIRDLSNVTSKKDIFDVEEISYYGNTGFCIHNIFKSQDSYEIYKLLYCTTLLVLLSIVSTVYINIILKQRRSTKAIADIAGPKRNNSASAQLTLKVALMIGSQLLCWFPFILSVLYFQYVAKKPASPMVFEIFALMVGPINSFLNPVFYGELYKKAVPALWSGWRRFVNKIAPMIRQDNVLTNKIPPLALTTITIVNQIVVLREGPTHHVKDN